MPMTCYYYYCVFIWVSISLDHCFGWELQLVVYLFFMWYFREVFFIIFVILLAVSLSSVCSLHNISVFFTFVELLVWIPFHSSSSSICSWVSVGSPHLRNIIIRRCIYPCNCCFTSNILIHSIQMVDSSILVSLFIYVFLLPGFQVVLLSRYCILVVPSAFVFIVSANIVMMSIFVMVSVFCSPMILVLILVKCISFQHRYVWLSIIFATSLSGFFYSFSQVQSVFVSSYDITMIAW